jgi:soluble lytic murein transglycosylase-like protein
VFRVLARCIKQLWRLPWWVQIPALGLTPLVVLNLAVATLGHSVISPFSPFFLEAKWAALKAYSHHLGSCWWAGHENAEALAEQAERRHRLPRGLMRAVVYVESRGETHRISHAGAIGPAQLIPTTALMMKVTDPFDPAQSVEGGAAYLRRLLDQFNGNVRLAVAAYNAGPGAVHGEVPQNGETEVYVKRVMARLTETTH